MTVTGSGLTGILARSDVTTVIMAGAALTASADNNVEVPSGKTLAVIDDLDLSSATYTINAYQGILDLKSGRLTNATGDILMLSVKDKKFADENSKITGTPDYVGLITLSDIAAGTAAGPAMIEGLAIGTGTNAVAADRLRDYMNGRTLYINGPLTTNVANPFLTTNVTVYGETTAEADITLTGSTNLQGPLVAGASITITGLNNFTKTLNIASYDVEAGADSVTLARLDGSGTLELSHAALSAVSIGGGTGNAAVNVTGAAPDFTSGASFGNTGLTTFDNAVTVSSGTITFAGPVDFDDALTFTVGGASFGGDATFEGAVSGADEAVTFVGFATFKDTFATTSGAAVFQSGASFEGTAGFGGDATITGDVTFGGDVTTGGDTIINGAALFDDASLTLFASGGAITFNDNVTFTALKAVTTGTDAITLKAGKKLIVGTDDVITAGAGGNVVLTPSGASTTLTFGAKKITQNDGDIKITGPATLAAGASYEVSADNDLEIDTSSTLTLDTGAGLILTRDTTNPSILKGEGSLIAGATTIVGGTTGWSVTEDTSSVGGNITITPNTIAGSTAAMVLTAGDNEAVITVAAGGTLNIAVNTKINLKGTNSAAVGSIVLEKPASPDAGAILSFAQGTTSIVRTANTPDGGTRTKIQYAADPGAGLTFKSTSGNYLITITSVDDSTPHIIQANNGTYDAVISGESELQS
jgi:hypothetical protein